MYKNIPQQILSKEMTRREFLRMFGLIILGLVGLPQLLSLLHRSSGLQAPAPQRVSAMGYGARSYGN